VSLVEKERPFEDDDDHSPLDDDDQTGQDRELQTPEEEEDLGDIPLPQEAGIESEIVARAASVPRQFTPQRPPRHLLFMTPQVTKPNGALSLADRVRGRRSTSTVGRASLVRWQEPEVVVPDMDQKTPTQNAEPLPPRVSDSERQVRPISQLQNDHSLHVSVILGYQGTKAFCTGSTRCVLW